MKFRSLHNWNDPASLHGLVFFAQLLEEALFDFSLDTYKPSIMHSGLLCREALLTIEEVEKGSIKEPNVKHVIEELLHELAKDQVAQSLSSLPFSAFTPTLCNPKISLQDKRVSLNLLAGQLAIQKYQQRNEKLLKEAITAGEKPDIRRLARTYLTTILAQGYSTQFVRESAKEHFHYSDKIEDVSSLDIFFSFFNRKPKKYTVYFRLEPIFEHIAAAVNLPKLRMIKELPPSILAKNFPTVAVKADPRELFVEISDLEDDDQYSVRLRAESLLRLTSTLLSLYHHKENPEWSADAIVVDHGSQSMTLVERPINAMHRCADLTQPVAAKRLKSFMSNFSLEHDSFSKFIRSSQLHSLAVKSNSDENQLLNLWIALESLVPSETKADDVNNIQHIIDSLTPLLSQNYLETLTKNLARDLLLWNKKTTFKALRGINGSNLGEKLLRVLALPEHATRYNELLVATNDFYLLHDRIERMHSVFSSTSSALDTLTSHTKRIEWQLRRIYRARNVIVHSGTTPSYTGTIIEHIHNYLDIVLNLLIDMASKPKEIYSVAEGFKLSQMKYDQLIKKLADKSVVLDDSTVVGVFFIR